MLGEAVPQLPVASLKAALVFYGSLGFEQAWAAGPMAGLSYGACSIFLREDEGAFTPHTVWINATDVDAAHDAWVAAGARIVAPLADMPWGVRQATFEDLEGHRLILHHG
ncbi:MAG: VOC family protein [Shimia sp.]